VIKAIISDADGTFVNTVYLIRHGQYETTVTYLKEKGIPPHDIPPYEFYESFINKSVGGPTRETFKKTLELLFSDVQENHLSKINFDELDNRLAPVQDHLAPLYVHPFHGLTELFTWTGKNAINIGIFTSGNRRMIIRNFGISLPVLGYMDLFHLDSIPIKIRFQAFIERIKAVYGMSKFAVVTCEDVTKTKPDPEGILKLMDMLMVTSEEVILLGDHPVDMAAAKAANIHSVGISHGFGTPADLKEAGALRIIDDLALLPKLIELHNNDEYPLF
jgi:phosphoglycolate phosphatase-like HAD superfamily hydrolase